MDDLCIVCGAELLWMDSDPNGCLNPVCARCRAEEDHDFDKYPDVTFDRFGNAISAKRKSQ